MEGGRESTQNPAQGDFFDDYDKEEPEDTPNDASDQPVELGEKQKLPSTRTPSVSNPLVSEPSVLLPPSSGIRKGGNSVS